MKQSAIVITTLVLVLVAPLVQAEEPDYSIWAEILEEHYDPVEGMGYAALARDPGKLQQLRRQMARVDVDSLTRDEQLAYWINLYNVNVVAIVVDHYPVDSIRDISTDLFVRLNVFKKDHALGPNGRMSLDEIEHGIIREQFSDPRIHFAINCAAASCPPIREEPYLGARLDEQLDDQTRRFLNGPMGVRLTRSGDRINVYTTKIMDWFSEDFDAAGGQLAFLRKYLDPGKRQHLDDASSVRIRYQDYDWSLNDR